MIFNGYLTIVQWLKETVALCHSLATRFARAALDNGLPEEADIETLGPWIA